MTVILLVCFAAITHAECDPNSAARVVKGPVVELQDCREWAPRWEADAEVKRLVGSGRYLKILCDYQPRLVS